MKKRILALSLAIVMAFALFAGCQSRNPSAEVATPAEPSSQGPSQSSSAAPPRAPSSKAEGETVADAVKTIDKLKDVKERKAQNSDTVGWLSLPELGISDVVVCNLRQKDSGQGPNKYYERKNFAEQDYFNGVLFADFRNKFGNGASTELGYNTVIYGHAMTDNPEKSNYDIFFGPLHDLRKEEKAKDMPYLFFTTEKENLAFEVIAVLFPNTSTKAAPYNTSDFYTQKEYAQFVRDEILPRSLWDYEGIEIKDTDKFLTLSTCAYFLPDGTATNYPNTWLRYVVMGRLVSPDEPLKKEASLKANTDIVQDDNRDHTAEFWSHLM